MHNIKLKYIYRDFGNYKNYGEAIYFNPDNIRIEEIAVLLRSHLIDGEWFYASRWGVPDLHFERYDDMLDHPMHSYIGLERTDEPATEGTVNELMKLVISGGAAWLSGHES